MSWRLWRGRRVTPRLLSLLTDIRQEEAERRLQRLEAEIPVYSRRLDLMESPQDEAERRLHRLEAEVAVYQRRGQLVTEPDDDVDSARRSR